MKRENFPFLTTLIWMLLWAGLLVTFLMTLPQFSEQDAFQYFNLPAHNDLSSYWEGHLYSDKSPLLFWFITSGWKLFGFSTWWPQLIVLILATASIFMSQQLARSLWPNSPLCQQLAPFILIGCCYWVWFTKEIRADVILVFATLLSLYSIIRAIQGKHHYWAVYILSIALGGFANGPVILVFILFPAIFLPTLLGKTYNRSPKWYGLLGLATICGLGIPLVTALTVGKTFTPEVFYDSMVGQDKHHESMLLHLLQLPVWLLPWSIYLPVWRNLKYLKLRERPSGETICLVITLCGLIIYSVFGEKFPIYPLFPIFALLIARLCSLTTILKTSDQWPMAGLLLILGLLCLLYPYIQSWITNPEVNLKLWGSLFLLMSALLFMLKTQSQLIQVIVITTASVLAALFINNALLLRDQPQINPEPLYAKLPLTHAEDRRMPFNAELI